MPQYLPPNKLTQHRVAAIALYRALLSRCSSDALPNNDNRVSLRNTIRNKFRRNRKIQSPYQLGLSFKAGYETLDRLDASAAGDETSTKLLAQLISQLPPALIRAPPIRPRRQASSTPPKERLACLPPERAVLNVRPYAKTSGPRHVPVLASANGTPFLRLTKPQPPALSRILRQRLQRKTDLFDAKVLLNNWWLPTCRQEDKWDDFLEEQLGEDKDSVKWIDAVRQAELQNQWAYERELRKDRDMTKDMQAIVDKEMELALKEGQTIVRGRKRRPILVIKPKS
ncbi:Complex1-LYR-1 multi-domain protein [Pyrenophora tritici-repentis]|uniref:Complex 1 protein n=2 Tax=Pyrenophora tritici-repentis TaxID=45151 RepID=A0A2W1FAT1_9PLEO|nr:uncharacterized protein PTRG_00825 [Pyrenophora tritici-repentis Pt-1C-BFP]KAA8625450.1 Complex1-LYR-1 multi-domain protein [Pyrenophora tritici-repentis]EDU40263.1 conserved hypothetical protein [Pyrenophora tritici-repentis Pt-1C-BFP]KAF7453852.1 Complex1-LYR-1 multi-domain protein [Pyrenophora tritici-repentis]KAF7576943.1 Complex1-LYR-1 multi-domain protein [Pyrenophora tritici-repentis]KAG9387611.1 Complex1-LYR-1 multi-domain protein [Pyrenophora tritici-repentis]